jgi:integrase
MSDVRVFPSHPGAAAALVNSEPPAIKERACARRWVPRTSDVPSIAILRAGRAAAHAPARSPARRSHAAAERSVDVRTVMEVLGHSQVGVTLNTYAHVLPHKAG